jgi:hypothetical protein
LEIEALGPHAELERVQTTADTLVLGGRLAGVEAASGRLRVRGGSGEDLVEDAHLHDGRFAATVPLARLRASKDVEEWRVHLELPVGEVPVAAHLDGMTGKDEIAVFPLCSVSGGSMRPAYDTEDRLVLRCGPAAALKADADHARGLETDAVLTESVQRRLLGIPAVLAHRAALAVVSFLWHGRGRPDPPRETAELRVLLLHAYGLGGTIRTTLNVVDQLRRHRSVEIVSVVRLRRHPRLPFPRSLRVSVLDDQRPRSRRTRREPSSLVGRFAPRSG